MAHILATGEAATTAAEAFSSAISGVQTDIMSFIGTALPVALGVAGAVLAIRFGWKFFKGMTK